MRLLESLLVASLVGQSCVCARTLPSAVERILPASALRDRKAVAPLWKAVRQCYPSEEAAVAALAKNPALCYSWACSVGTIKGSYAVLVEICGKEAALDVITKNPGALGNDPKRLQLSTAPEIVGAANVAAAFGALQSVAPAGFALAVLGAAFAAYSGEDVAALTRPVIGTIGASAFLGTAALAAYVSSRRPTES